MTRHPIPPPQPEQGDELAEPVGPIAPAGAVARVSAIVSSSALSCCVLAGICALVALRGVQPVANTDLGWHLALGRHIVESRAIPDSEPFTHTARGVPMVAHEWLSQAIYHGVAEVGGLLSLRALHAVLAVAILLFLFASLRRERVPPALALFAVLLYVAIAQARFQVRPQMFDLTCLVALYGWVFLYKPALRASQLAVIAAATVLWANLHSGALIFPALVGVYVAVELVQQWSGFRKPQESDLAGGRPGRLIALALVVGGAVFATPHGLRIVPYVLESGRLNREMSMEWLPLLDFWGHPAKSPLALEAYLLVVAAFACAAVLRLRRRDASLSTLACVTFATGLAFYSQRFVVLAIAAIWYALPELARVIERASSDSAKGRQELRRGVASGLAIAAVLVCVPVLLWPRGSLEGIARRFSEETSFRPRMFPVGAVRFLSELELTGKLFNPSKWGGYILFHTYDRYPVFVDGRWVTLGERVMADSQVIAMRKPGAFALLEEYGVDLVLVHRGWLTPAMRERNTWIPLFENLNAGLYLLNDPRNVEDLRRVAAYYRDRKIPFVLPKGFDERAAVRANSAWAERMDIAQWHLDQSQAYGDNMGSPGEWVRGW